MDLPGGTVAAIVDCFILGPSIEGVAASDCSSLDDLLSWHRPARDGTQLSKEARRLGLARAKSASSAAWMSMIVCAAGHYTLKGRRISLGVCSTTATESIGYSFARQGWERGWKVVDPFWLPNTIPSCVATSVFAALSLKGLAIGFPGGLHGFFGAMDHALSLLATHSVERSMVVIAEDDSAFHDDVATRGGAFQPSFTGAIGVVLERSKGTPGECTLSCSLAADEAALRHAGTRTGDSSETMIADIGDAHIPAYEIVRFFASPMSDVPAAKEITMVARDTGEAYQLRMERLR